MQPEDASPADETEFEPRPEIMAALGDGNVIDSDGEAGRSRVEFTCKPEMCHSGGIAQGGDKVSFKVVVQNTGNAPASQLVLSDKRFTTRVPLMELNAPVEAEAVSA